MERPVALRKQVNLLDCFVLIVGIVVGSGIFISPKGVLENTGTVGWALIAWVACGVFSTLAALCYAELGSSIQKSGGDYTYIMDSAGPIFAFLRVWTSVLGSRTGSDAVIVITAATYLMSPLFRDCEIGVPFAVTRMPACIILIATTFCNSISVPLTRKVQIIFTVAKLLGLAIIIISGIVLLFQGNTSNFQNAFNVQEVKWTQLPLAFCSGLFAYTGWQNVTNITEETINPAKIIPKSIIAAMTCITFAYFTTNVAYFVALSPEEILASDAVAVSYGLRVLGNWWILMPLAVALSCIGSTNGSIFAASRQLYVAGRDGQFPEVFSMVHINKRTPLPAAAIMLPVCCLMLVSDSVYSLINYLSFCRWAFTAMATASLPYFRWKYPDAERPFKTGVDWRSRKLSRRESIQVPLAVPVIFVLMAVLMVVGSIYSAPRDVGIGIIMTLSGIPVWFIFVRWENKPRRIKDVFVPYEVDVMQSCDKYTPLRSQPKPNEITIFLQRTFYVVPPDDVIEKPFDTADDGISSKKE